MTGLPLIGCAALILLLLPILVLQAEKRPIADRFHILLAAAGIGFAALSRGASGMALAVALGLSCLLLMTGIVAALSARCQVRLLTGGHIKLIAAGTTWLSPSGALIMLALSVALYCAVAILLRTRKAADPRPDMATITVAALLSAQLMTLA